ncbi:MULTISPECIES: hypothetical protein [unclassified Neptuniibacter]|uniref:hypothetical protein n=1 Tax=unclassified Neptuniibacter TaxID=2630693 RepID=UPI000C547FFC|nr:MULTISPECIES: hypothetical protein [unclassified Neptuniibacter]MAY41549.1 hypothetical protein [Oceanospirillaceae bacterium]|tara:strand:- start:968 stop:1417 length:450 start_codon:yes stop_codon:yes gene_type:complete
MEFITEGDAVKCIRVISEKPITVATFHIDVDRVAPHVASALSSKEIIELELWLKDRSKLQEALKQRPIEVTILEALPGVLDQAANAISELGEVDKNLYQTIRKKISRLTYELDSIEQFKSKTKNVQLDKIPNSEVLKERLETIKDNIEN